MRLIDILPLALAASAFVIPDTETAESLRIQLPDENPWDSIWENVPSPKHVWEETEKKFHEVVGDINESFEETYEYVQDATVAYGESLEHALDTTGDWLNNLESEVDLLEEEPPHHPPHRGPPPPPPHHGGPPPPEGRPPHHGPPGRRPHHPPHHRGPPNETVYQLIAKSKYTTKLAKLINEYDDLVKLLNGTKANFTVFAPTDRAFEKIPKHIPKPSKEQLKKLLTYHVSPEFYPAGRILVTRTIPTAFEAELIGKVPQRLSTQIGFRGLTVNYYARVIAPNIFGTNGVIHGIDSLLIPPPRAIDIIQAFPGEFSTLELALTKTGLFDAFNKTHHGGGTLFAPSNSAFQRLGPRLNAFLFSRYGLKYLKALVLYHVADNITLYSDALYNTESSNDHHRIPKGVYHIDLQTALEGKHLSVDIARYGRLITIKINGFTRVAVTDGIADDGVIHVVPNLLIPPKKPEAAGEALTEDFSVEELIERLEPFTQDDVEDKYWDL